MTKPLAAACALLTILTACAATTPSATVPNIVLVVFDDADTESVMAMPKIRRLVADEGATFERFYVTQPLCCPSRASLLTGEHVHTHRVITNGAAEGGGFPAFLERGHEERTIAKVLQRQGIRTGLFGKYLNDYGASISSRSHRPPFWDRWFGKLDHNNNYEIGFNDDGRRRFYPRETRVYSDDLVLKTALRWIERTNAGGRPVFAYVAPHAPHIPQEEPPGYTTGFETTRFWPEDKPSFNEQDIEDKPPFLRSEPLTPEAIEGLRSDLVHRLRRMRVIDDFVGRLVAALRRSGWLRRTYIVLTSDNGWLQGEHRRVGGKIVPYEESIRVPLVVRGPEIPPNTRIDELASMIDIYPTFVELVGARPDRDGRDGRSLVPLLEGRRGRWRSRLLVESLRRWDVQPYSTIVTSDLKLTSWEDGSLELYNLRSDPHELENLASTADRGAISELSGHLEALTACGGETCRRADGGP